MLQNLLFIMTVFSNILLYNENNNYFEKLIEKLFEKYIFAIFFLFGKIK